VPGLDDVCGVSVCVEGNDVGAVDVLEEVVLVPKCGIVVVVVVRVALVAAAVVVFVRHLGRRIVTLSE
jgi:hypothetical protein